MERQHKATRRVLVVENGSLLDEGVKNLLRRKTALNVSGVTYTDEATLLKDISQLSPDVIVLNEVDPSQAARLFALLTGAPAVRVIVTRLSDNAVKVYDKQEVRLTASADLVSLILDPKLRGL
jgi:DNA-binding NarL/FixJ family response regulator